MHASQLEDAICGLTEPAGCRTTYELYVRDRGSLKQQGQVAVERAQQHVCRRVQSHLQTQRACWLQEGEPSYELYAKERAGLLDSLKKRARWLEDALNSMEGVTCNAAEGALYAMPRIRLPKKASEVRG